MPPLAPQDFPPAGRRFTGSDRRAPLRTALSKAGHYGPGQTAGRFYPIACVALEITQRCNLDCTLCYLSERAEAAHDIPLPVLFARLAQIESHYGPATSVQITGGDPTLRRPEDLEALCREIARLGMRSCLMTNGIRASRALLTRLAAAGLDDVAFHVDLTQERKGFATEAALNAVRREYLARARGLGLRVLFNTTVFEGNLDEVAGLAAFFRDHASAVTLASFQLQADTGRGVLRAREAVVCKESVAARLAEGMGATLDFETAAVGHPECTRYASVVVAGEHTVSALSDKALVERLFAAFGAQERPGTPYLRLVATARRLAWRHPGLALAVARHALALLWRLRAGLVRGHPPQRLALLIHDFMDASALDRARCESCVFMVATGQGPLSMCVHNARRDAHLFAPERLGDGWWSAATGQVTPEPDPRLPGPQPRKRLKGRQRAKAEGRSDV